MELYDEKGDAFDVGIFWRPSIFSESADITYSELFPFPELDLPSAKLDNPYAPVNKLDHELRLPNLDSFEFGSFADAEHGETTASSTDGALGWDSEEPDDMWNADAAIRSPKEDIQYFSWERLEEDGHKEGRSAYISEARRHAFDSLIHQRALSTKSAVGESFKPDVLLSCLFQLGLGRSSRLFTFNDDTKAFELTMPNVRLLGCTSALSYSVIQQFLAGGSTFKYLRNFITQVYKSTKSISARIALANSISTILAAMETYLDIQSVEGLLQLQKLFERPHQILAQVKEMVEVTRPTNSNDTLMSTLYSFIESREQQDEHARAVCLRFLSTVARPWLQQVSEWIGLDDDRCLSNAQDVPPFVDITPASGDPSSGPPVDEYSFKAEMMPSFMTEEDGLMIFETGNAVRFLRSHHPRHPLSSNPKPGVAIPQLAWEFSWKDMDAIEDKAKAYERSLLGALAELKQQKLAEEPAMPENQYDDTCIGTKDEPSADLDAETYVLQSMEQLNAIPSYGVYAQDDLHTVITKAINPETGFKGEISDVFAPPLSLTPSLSLTPLIVAQSRLVNAVTLRLFFRSHALRHHLSLQRQYHLLGDGVFVARLSSALFSPELATAERRKGTVRTGSTMGLRLGNRTNWPPASSELRLAVMGILSDCYHSSSLYLSASAQDKRPIGSLNSQGDLPGQLSFAVRTLPEEDMEKLMNPKSLYALDFLRLQYVAPPPLHLVISSGALEKYDEIFKLLLRLLRILYVVNQLPRTSSFVATRLRIETRHFVVSIANYFFETGIRCKWDGFSHLLDGIECRLQREDDDSMLGELVHEGLYSLKKAHEDCLDRIMFTLFLRKRHARVRRLLEEIFECILRFASLMETEADPAAEQMEELRVTFNMKVDVFLKVCRGLGGKKGKGAGTSGGDEGDIDRFLVLMDMNNCRHGLGVGNRRPVI